MFTYSAFTLLDGKACPLMYNKHSCLQLNGNIIIIMCNSKNWFDARSFCVKNGGDLAILDSPDLVQATKDYITDHRLTKHCSILYIGLQLTAWHFTAGENFTSKTSHSNINVFIFHCYVDKRTLRYLTVTVMRCQLF